MKRNRISNCIPALTENDVCTLHNLNFTQTNILTKLQINYKTKSEIKTIYQTKSAAATIYLTKAEAEADYQTTYSASIDYLSKTEAATEYQTKVDAEALYRTRRPYTELNMNNNKISNLATGTHDNDAVNVYQLNDKFNRTLSLKLFIANTIERENQNPSVYYHADICIHMDSNRIVNLGDGVNGDDAVNLRQLNSRLLAATRDMNSHRIINLANAQNDNDAVNLRQLRTINRHKTKSGVLRFNRYGISIIFKYNPSTEICPINLFILTNASTSQWDQEPIIMMEPFILFVPSDYSIFNNKPYRFNYIIDTEDTKLCDL